MPTVKIVVSNPQAKKAIQKEFEEPQAVFLGRKIGEKVPADSIGLAGYELEITGGSDKEGFPMRKDIEGQARKRVILSSPPGYHPDRKGKRKRKSVRGNTISSDIVQINTKVAKAGPKPAEELWGIKPKEKPKEEKAEKKETKPEAKAEEKPKREPQKEEKPKEADSAGKAEAADNRKQGSRKPQAELAEAKMGVKKVE